MFNLGAFLLDPLNLTGIQNAPQRPAPAAPAGQPGMLYPELQPDLDLSLQPPPGTGPSGNADGRGKPKGFLEGLMGGSGPMQHAVAQGTAAPLPPPSWVYQQGKGPVWQSQERTPQGGTKPVFNPTFTGNRI